MFKVENIEQVLHERKVKVMSKDKKVYINKEAKQYLLNYLEDWINHLSTFDFSFRKGIVRAIYNKVESIPILEKED